MKKALLFIILLTLLICSVQAQKGMETKEVSNMYTDTTLKLDFSEKFSVLRSKTSIKHGMYRLINSDEEVITEGNYVNNLKDGEWKFHYPNAPHIMKAEGSYASGVKTGEWKLYFLDGQKLREKINYIKGEDMIAVERYYDNENKKNGGLLQRHDTTYAEVGHWQYFYSNGKTEKEGTYSVSETTFRSLKVQTWQCWYDNGNLKYEESYNNDGKLDGKKTYYNEQKGIEKYEYYKDGQLTKSEDKYDFQKITIDSLFVIAEKYKAGIPIVYNNEISAVLKDYSNYGSATKDNGRYEQGKTIITKLKYICKYYDELLTTEKSIGVLYQKLDSLYFQFYPLIYKSEIKPFDSKIAAYKEIGFVEQKLNTGNELLDFLTKMNSKFDKYRQIETFFQQKIPAIEKLYRDSFNLVYTNEIKKIQPQKLRFENINVSNNKLDTGIFLVNLIKKYDSCYVELKKKESIINTKLPVIQKIYKDNYTNLYKIELARFMIRINRYKQLNLLDQKLESGKNIIDTLNIFDDNIAKLKVQGETIKAKHDDFVKKFEDDKANKYFFKRCKSLFEDMFDLYKKDGSSKHMLELGDELILVLNKLSSFYGKENTYLNSQLKEAKNADEVKKILGL